MSHSSSSASGSIVVVVASRAAWRMRPYGPTLPTSPGGVLRVVGGACVVGGAVLGGGTSAPPLGLGSPRVVVGALVPGCPAGRLEAGARSAGLRRSGPRSTAITTATVVQIPS